jgi:uncharacterized membrane protein
MQNQQEHSEITAERTSNEVVAVHTKHFSGPLPHPSILEHYNRIVPNAAERIFSEFEQQTRHRIEIEKKVISSAVWKEKWGLIFGFFFAMVTVIGGIYSALQGAPVLGGSLSFAGIAMIIGAFLSTKFSATRDE